jgi:hypothetical protein
MPRYFLAANVQLFDHENHLVSDLRHRSLHALRNIVSVCTDDLPVGLDLAPLEDNRFASCAESIGDVTVVARSSDRLELEFTADQQCVLFLSHTWHPGWQATLDGQATTVFPANHAFQGIHIPTAGKHRVVLTYRADYAWQN